jgi:methyl-accepting chemotaxis protein
MQLRVGTKIGLIIALLALTALGIAALGYFEVGRLNARLQRMVEVTAQKVKSCWEMRVNLVRAVATGRAAILSDRDDESARFKGYSEKAASRVKENLDAFEELLKKYPSEEDRANLEVFKRRWVRFAAEHAEGLALSVQNTKARARTLAHGELAERVTSLDEAFRGLLRQVEKVVEEATAAKDVARLATAERKGRAYAAGRTIVLDLHRQLYQHINASDDSERDRLEKYCQALQRELRALLAELGPSADEKSRGLLTVAGQEFDKLQEPLAQALKLSRIDSEGRGVILTLGRSQKTLEECINALEVLSNKVDERYAEQMKGSQAGAATAQLLMLAAPAVGIPLGILLALLLTRSITRPMARGVELSEAIAKGDLTRRLNLRQRDEVGLFAQAVDEMAATFARSLGEVRRVCDALGGSAADLSAVSHQLLAQSEEMSTQAASVAGSTEQMNVNINSMAAAAEQMSMNVVSISSASEEISVNVGTISTGAKTASSRVNAVAQATREATTALEAVAENVCGAARVTARATEMAQQATGTMNALDRAAGEISKVTEAIKMIAVQTNLLALNATIEATSAGEAGKGFAVVAHEIKELANQSGRAAEDIARKIEGVQSSTREAVQVIQGVSEIIGNINTSAERISTAVTRQMQTATASTGHLAEAGKGVEAIAASISEVAKGATDMSRNAAEAAKGASDVSRNAAEAARGVGEIASNIHGVSDATRDNTVSAQKVKAAADHLKGIAEDLQRIIAQFKLDGSVDGRLPNPSTAVRKG